MFKHLKTFMIVCVSMGALAACQTTAQSASTNPVDAQRVWQLSQMPEFTASQLSHTSMDWRNLPKANAHMGCNRLMFQANLDNSGSLKVDDRIAATRMYCADTMALETAFTSNITKMTRYRIENQNTLILDNQNGLEMRFIAK